MRLCGTRVIEIQMKYRLLYSGSDIIFLMYEIVRETSCPFYKIASELKRVLQSYCVPKIYGNGIVVTFH